MTNGLQGIVPGLCTRFFIVFTRAGALFYNDADNSKSISAEPIGAFDGRTN